MTPTNAKRAREIADNVLKLTAGKSGYVYTAKLTEICSVEELRLFAEFAAEKGKSDGNHK